MIVLITSPLLTKPVIPSQDPSFWRSPHVPNGGSTTRYVKLSVSAIWLTISNISPPYEIFFGSLGCGVKICHGGYCEALNANGNTNRIVLLIKISHSHAWKLYPLFSHGNHQSRVGTNRRGAEAQLLGSISPHPGRVFHLGRAPQLPSASNSSYSHTFEWRWGQIPPGTQVLGNFTLAYPNSKHVQKKTTTIILP